MVNWQDIHPDLTEELVKEWKDWYFSYNECKKWIDTGFIKSTDVGYVQWLKNWEHKTIQGFIDYENKESLREKYKSHLNWYWTKHDKKSIYYPSDYVKFLEKGKINAQEWLEENYPKNGTCRIKEVGKFGKTRKKIKELTIRKKAVEGELDLSDFKNLKGLYCSDNHLTQIIYPANSENITGLSISNNNLLPQDLSVF